jgi:hypothetical protein
MLLAFVGVCFLVGSQVWGQGQQGFHLVSIVPLLAVVSRPIAHVILVKGDQWRTVAERLHEEAIWSRGLGRSHDIGRVQWAMAGNALETGGRCRARTDGGHVS